MGKNARALAAIIPTIPDIGRQLKTFAAFLINLVILPSSPSVSRSFVAYMPGSTQRRKSCHFLSQWVCGAVGCGQVAYLDARVLGRGFERHMAGQFGNGLEIEPSAQKVGTEGVA